MRSQAILYLSSKSNAWSITAYTALRKVASADVFFAYHLRENELPDNLQGLEVFPFTDSILHDLGYTPIEDSLLPGSNHFPLLKFYREHPGYDYYWLIEDDVRFSGEWNLFFDAFTVSDADFVSACITAYRDEPEWYWWPTLETGEEDIKEREWLRSFNPVYRLSNKAMRCLDEHLLAGWKGHHECLIPTLLNHAGLKIEDIGGKGEYVREGNKDRFYDEESYGLRPVLPQTREGRLFHPVKEEKTGVPRHKNCVFVPVGETSLHRQLLNGAADFDLHLLIYDKSYNKWCDDTDYICADSGYKMDMTYRYLHRHPEYLESYEYFFLMDDDIEMSTEEVNKLFLYMREYNLKIAQPSLVMSYYTYEHTLHNPTCILRYTNFVEMMMPCFSQEALRLVLPTFEKKVRWMGIEWHWPVLIKTNQRDIAIIDCIEAVHSRQLQSWSSECSELTKKYLTQNNLSDNISIYGYVLQKEIDEDEYEMNRILISELSQLELLFRKNYFCDVKNSEIIPIAVFYLLYAECSNRKRMQDVAFRLIEFYVVRLNIYPKSELDKLSCVLRLLRKKDRNISCYLDTYPNFRGKDILAVDIAKTINVTCDYNSTKVIEIISQGIEKCVALLRGNL